jgi:RND family efflux transporter MFP subunit
MKIVIQLLLIIAIGFGAYFGRQYLVDNAPIVPPKVTVPFVPTVQVVPVSPAVRTLYIEAHGTISSPSRLALAPEVAGRAVRVSDALQEGAFLEMGTELVAIDEADYTLAREAAAANVAARNAALDLELANAEVAVADWNALHEGTPPALVGRTPQIAAARAAVAGAVVAERQAKLNLERATLRMPFDGRIIEKTIERGQRVGPTAPLLTIEKIDDLEARLSVSLSDLAFLNLDLAGNGAETLQLTLSAKIGGETYQWAATGRRTVPLLDTRNPVVTLIVKVGGPVGAGPAMAVTSLLPGLFVTAKIRGREDVFVTAIPRSALQVDGSFFTVDSSGKLRRQAPDFLQLTETEALVAADVSRDGTLRVVTLAPTIAIEGMDVLVGVERPSL